MSVIALNPDQPQVEIRDGRLHIRSVVIDGAVVELAEELGISDKPDELAKLLAQVTDTGAIVVGHGHRRAAVDAIAAEIERLMTSTAEETGKLPSVIQAQLGEHLAMLAAALDSRFDASRTSSVQHQIAELVKGATSEQVRALIAELLGDRGPLAASNQEIAKQLNLVLGANADVLGKVTSLIEKVEAKHKLDEQHDRSTHKGRPFEERLETELAAIHGPLGDSVRCVADETGLVSGSEAGDHLVTISSQQTGGREARIVIEAKTGKLSRPKAHAALEAAIKNRCAQAGILVFDGVEDAQLGGRHYMPYPNGRIIAVLDEEHGTLGFEVACVQARLFALAVVAAEGTIDAKWLTEQCDTLTRLVEEASKIKRGSAAARRGLDTVDQGYDELRRQALDLLDEIKAALR